MASAAVMSAVKTRLDAFWTRTPIYYPNAAQQVPATGSHLLVQFPVSDEEQITVGAPGNNVFREEGAIRFVLNAPRGAGADDYATWMDELRAHFRGKQFSGLTTWAASPPVFDDDSEAGKVWRLSCVIPYQYDLFA